MAEKQAAGLAPKSIQKIRLVFRCSKSPEVGRDQGQPMRWVRLPRAEQAEPVFLSAERVEVLARETRKPFHHHVRFAAATGLRRSELCAIRIGRLNLLKGTVEVAEAVTVVSGPTEIGPTKSYARRTVGLPRSICEDLGEYLAGRATEEGGALTPDAFLFTAPKGGLLRQISS